MFRQHARPKWWQVYLTFPLLVGLFYADSRLKLSARGHQIVQLAIILLVYGLIHLWVKANAMGLESQSDTPPIIITRVQVFLPPQKSLLRLPNSEIKGVLDTTFDMDSIDAEFLPLEESAQTWKEE